ncbi:hypothetical protein I316_01393 [Kwoniella heveanensis BCC8398]|uniref:Uncharacterized protein n=1 Tax=Kwoniella heveanensis BCC8398 TaxID=1296120 RepID=A0A1B9H0M6_9TREE|nr:hypothetical protein I316_01393 [Kwoniella heveanensis BCC8398]
MSYEERNNGVINDCYEAEGKLQRAWGYGDPRAYERVSRFADWFEDVYLEINDLFVFAPESPAISRNTVADD